ncbi:MAG: hypothetical protein U0P45_03640 [Acidimicrobiales bacterium]
MEPSNPPVWAEVSVAQVDWVVDVGFLSSSWTCIWGRGCLGILDEPAEHLAQGCCSVGAQLEDQEEAQTIAALAALLGPEAFEHHDEAAAGGVFADEDRTATRLVDGACIFLNRPGFAGGAGCALHLGALADGEPPMDWKPSVCWRLPLRVDVAPGPDGRERATLRRWARGDWGEGGANMAWCCTEGDRAYVGVRPVAESLAEELEALVGAEAWVEIRPLAARAARPDHGPTLGGPGRTERRGGSAGG